MLENDGEAFKEFQERLEVAKISIWRLPGRLGRSWPVEFVLTLPDDPIDDDVQVETNDQLENNDADKEKMKIPK